MARETDQRGDVDTHRADHGAAPAHGARVEQQLLPLLQIFDGDSALEVERAIEPGERPGFTLVGLLERFEFPDRRVLRIVGRHVEMAGFRALSAMDARLHVGGGRRGEIAGETLHRDGDALRVGESALPVGAHFRLPDREARRFHVDGIDPVVVAHVAAPLRAAAAPVIPRETNTRKAWLNLPNGSQTNSSSTLSRWIASGSGSSGTTGATPEGNG